jgi:endoglucanase
VVTLRCLRLLPCAIVVLAVACGLLAPAATAESPLPGIDLGLDQPLPAPVEGQDPAPQALDRCQGNGVPGAQVPGVDPRGVDPASRNPLVGLRFFVDPTEPAFRTYMRYARQRKQRDARLMSRIALRPRFRWLGRWTGPDLADRMRHYLRCVAAVQPGTVPLIAVLRAQSKACHPSYTAGGAGEDAATRRWYETFAQAVGNARVVIAFEPDSLGTVDCLARARQRARLDTLRYGVDVLSRLPNATIYLEAGASDWEPAERTARQLRYIGIAKVRGFMLNTTHYDWTANNISHGLDISRLTGGKHFIISTAFNGRGPVHYRRWLNRRRQVWRRINVWCHPLKRGLGPAPTTATARPDKVDAYMWIGRPGYSGGSCNGGPLPIGTWWPKRALMFARYATNWLRPPQGTADGLRRRLTLSQLGA